MSRPVSQREAREVVSHLIQMLSGDKPLAEADECLDRAVVIHVDDAEIHRGVALWKRWVHLMRECGRLQDLRFEPATMDVTGDVTGDLVRVTFRWSGETRRGRETGRPRTSNRVQYRVQDGRITEIWTRKANYTDIFGGWIRVTVFYRLFLLWGLVYFLVRRDAEFRLKP